MVRSVLQMQHEDICTKELAEPPNSAQVTIAAPLSSAKPFLQGQNPTPFHIS